MRGLHHGARITDWENINGPIVAAMINAGATNSWPSSLHEFVTTITANDFHLGDANAAQDLIAVGIK